MTETPKMTERPEMTGEIRIRFISLVGAGTWTKHDKATFNRGQYVLLL